MPDDAPVTIAQGPNRFLSMCLICLASHQCAVFTARSVLLCVYSRQPLRDHIAHHLWPDRARDYRHHEPDYIPGNMRYLIGVEGDESLSHTLLSRHNLHR